MKITFLGHAAFYIESGDAKILIDPFLPANPEGKGLEPNYICVTHGHSDHVGSAVEIAKRTGAVIIGSVDLIEGMFSDQGVNTDMGNVGGKIPTSFGSVKIFQAIHGSGCPGAVATGFIIDVDGKKVYHAGDTSLMSDMQFLADAKLDAALLPIGDRFTMGPGEAVKAAKMIGAKVTIPMHYNTFPLIAQDADAYADAVKAEGLNSIALSVGESIEI